MVSESVVRIGVIGSGRWAELVHIPAVVTHPNAALTAVCSRTPETANRVAAKFNADHAVNDYRQLLDDYELDAVIVCTPNSTHCEIAKAAVDRGLHVLCEKPLGMDFAETVPVCEAAEQAGVKHMVAFTTRFLPHARWVADLMHEPWTGPLYHFNTNKQAGYGGIGGTYRWRWDRELAGAGVLADLGSHAIDVGRWFVGEIERVCSHLATFIHERPDVVTGEPRRVEVDDSSAFLVQFENGVQGVFHISWVAHKGRVQTVELCGQDGALILDTNPEGWEMRVKGCRQGEDAPTEMEIPPAYLEGVDWESPDGPWQAWIHSRQAPAGSFIDTILQDLPPSPSFVDGAKTQAVIDAVLQSAREERWVKPAAM